ncbi:MAG TPA: hypothetical protein VH482_21285 [Thermomicrobiales bacterium]|jgi:hypothetical protein
MSHRKALAASIAMTVVLALTIFVARARLFQPTIPAADGLVPPAADVVDTTGNPQQILDTDTTTTEQTADTLPVDAESAALPTRSETRDRNDEHHERDNEHDNQYEDD